MSLGTFLQACCQQPRAQRHISGNRGGIPELSPRQSKRCCSIHKSQRLFSAWRNQPVSVDDETLVKGVEVQRPVAISSKVYSNNVVPKPQDPPPHPVPGEDEASPAPQMPYQQQQQEEASGASATAVTSDAANNIDIAGSRLASRATLQSPSAAATPAAASCSSAGSSSPEPSISRGRSHSKRRARQGRRQGPSPDHSQSMSYDSNLPAAPPGDLASFAAQLQSVRSAADCSRLFAQHAPGLDPQQICDLLAKLADCCAGQPGSTDSAPTVHEQPAASTSSSSSKNNKNRNRGGRGQPRAAADASRQPAARSRSRGRRQPSSAAVQQQRSAEALLERVVDLLLRQHVASLTLPQAAAVLRAFAALHYGDPLLLSEIVQRLGRCLPTYAEHALNQEPEGISSHEAAGSSSSVAAEPTASPGTSTTPSTSNAPQAGDASADRTAAAFCTDSPLEPLAQALCSLDQLRHPVPQRLLESAVQLSSQVEHLQRLPLPLACRFAQALARLGYRPPLAWMEQLTAVTYRQLSAMGSAQLTQLAAACGDWGYSPGESWWAEWSLRSRQSMQGFSGQQLTQLLRAFVALGKAPDEAWARSALQRTSRLLPGMPPRQLASLAHSLAQLRCLPSAQWVREFSQRTRPKLRLCSPAEMATLGAAMARLSALSADSAAPLAPDAAWLAELTAQSFSKLSFFMPQQFAALAGALADLGHRPNRLWLSEFSYFSLAKMPQCPRVQLVALLHALVRLGHEPPKPWLIQFERQTHSQLGSLVPEALADAAWALSAANYRPDESWLYGYVLAAYRHLDELSAPQLKTMFDALPAISPHPDWVDELVQICASEVQLSGGSGMTPLQRPRLAAHMSTVHAVAAGPDDQLQQQAEEAAAVGEAATAENEVVSGVGDAVYSSSTADSSADPLAAGAPYTMILRTPMTPSPADVGITDVMSSPRSFDAVRKRAAERGSSSSSSGNMGLWAARVFLPLPGFG